MNKVLFSLILFLTFTQALESQTVNTQYGPVTGHMNETVYEFLGIPYASPPVGMLRWKPTVAPQAWSLPVVADSFPPSCPQKRFIQGEPDTLFTLEGEEDCLYLNIWSPDLNQNLPVMVFIHGGGNQQGSTSQITGGTEIYHGKNLSSRGNVVVVTIEYRLGVLGYLVHPGLELENTAGISGNYAVMDQLFALQWIQQNITAFGGNPENITIFGESAGGVNVGNLLTAPLAAGLFQKAIIQSAAPVVSSYSGAASNGIALVDAFIADGNDAEKIAYMRTVHADSISKTLHNPMAGGMVQMSWQPVVDNYIFNDFPENVFQSGAFNKVPLMIGSNAEEMSLSVVNYPDIVCAWLVDSIIQATVPPDWQNTAYMLYPVLPLAEAKKSATDILTDAQFTATTRRTAQCVAANQTESVWRYFFTHTHTLDQLAVFGSYHGMELFYAFNNWENATFGSGPLFRPADDSTQQNMLTYWTQFARTGNPNNGILPEWPLYVPAHDNYHELKATPDGSQRGLRIPQCILWDTVAGFSGCDGAVALHEVSPGTATKVYPNPSDGIFYLEINEKEIGMVNVYNSNGQKVFSEKGKTAIDLRKQQNGIYFLIAETRKGSKSTKIVIRK